MYFLVPVMCGGNGGLQTAMRKPKHDIPETLQSGSNILQPGYVRDMFTVHFDVRSLRFTVQFSPQLTDAIIRAWRGKEINGPTVISLR